jgi:L-amino acid N-acyltransferase YncA|tara:strand:+ start:49 stop:555 length:507 start_codon:yes stop_codon:yes gene_type:complete
MSLIIRDMDSSDCETLVEIYNSIVEERVATFNTGAINIDTIASWPNLGSVIVADYAGETVGFVRSFPYRNRECYEGVAQFSIYIAMRVRGKGIGDHLLHRFIDEMEAAGKWKVLSRVFPENTASIGLLEKHGFRQVGLYKNHAKLDGGWRDVVIIEKLLGEADDAVGE